MRSTNITAISVVIFVLMFASSLGAQFTHEDITLSHDAYVIRWQQEVMPITDLSVLNLLVNDQQLRELAGEVLADSDNLEDSRFYVSCHSNSEPSITPHGATIQVTCGVSRKVLDGELQLTNQQRARLRKLFLNAWEESFRSVYNEAAKSRIADWHVHVEALKNQRRQAEDLAELLRDRLSQLEQKRRAEDARSNVLAKLEDRIAQYRMKKDEMTARREALETHMKTMKENAASEAEKSPQIIEHFQRALALEEKRLAAIKRRRDQAKDSDDRVFEAENRVLEARIALERAQRESAGSDQMEALLHELHQVNVELMQVIFAIRESEQHHTDAAKPPSADASVPSITAVKQAHVEYELAERRLMKLTERAAEVEDSGDNIISPLTFIRLSK